MRSRQYCTNSNGFNAKLGTSFELRIGRFTMFDSIEPLETLRGTYKLCNSLQRSLVGCDVDAIIWVAMDDVETVSSAFESRASLGIKRETGICGVFALQRSSVERDVDAMVRVDMNDVETISPAFGSLAALGMKRRTGVCGNSLDRRSFDFKFPTCALRSHVV